ncbi:hypothetical protein [Leisingera sp. ANG-M7]|uniref:hypothetical protein n=1 Tax=Leisingera sp. ANG-M7 TaxID=1577902 RepID=UPI00057C9F67|nr:hypothetical protein [Leisingera sp. ANG-M7]KIC35743.1 hypothetical protein RA26_15710 [Leisingera sp. ANG-M7]
MLANLLNFYDHYPSILLSLKGMSRAALASDLLQELDFHGERQREIFDIAQTYQIDEQAELMLRSLSAQMQNDGLDSMFSSVRLPFPAMLLTVPEPATGLWPAALVTQDEDTLYTQVYHANKGGLLPNLLVFKSQGASVDILHSPTLKLARASGDAISDDAAVKQEKSLCFDFLSIAVGMSILFERKAMLEKEEVPAYPRAERRRAQKSGRTLPNRTIIKVKLGDLGKRQVQASQETNSSDEQSKARRRAHWVQGHFMRNRAGGISWRNPHVRGAGPVLEQERHISFESE